VLAVGTNIIVRYLVADEPEQFAKARSLIDGEDIFVCTTVLLETEWVLRRGYRFSRDQIIAALPAFAGLRRVNLEDPVLAVRGLSWTARGMDFADALHLGKAGGCEAFVSFDQRFATVANAISAVKVRAP
jgi:predicted nucleic-acid-binding protein